MTDTSQIILWFVFSDLLNQMKKAVLNTLTDNNIPKCIITIICDYVAITKPNINDITDDEELKPAMFVIKNIANVNCFVNTPFVFLSNLLHWDTKLITQNHKHDEVVFDYVVKQNFYENKFVFCHNNITFEKALPNTFSHENIIILDFDSTVCFCHAECVFSVCCVHIHVCS